MFVGNLSKITNLLINVRFATFFNESAICKGLLEHVPVNVIAPLP